jgi:hypothetical protein
MACPIHVCGPMFAKAEKIDAGGSISGGGEKVSAGEPVDAVSGGKKISGAGSERLERKVDIGTVYNGDNAVRAKVLENSIRISYEDNGAEMEVEILPPQGIMYVFDGVENHKIFDKLNSNMLVKINLNDLTITLTNRHRSDTMMIKNRGQLIDLSLGF